MKTDRFKGRHQLLLIAMSVTILASALMLRKLWQSNENHRLQIELASQQKTAVNLLQSTVNTLVEQRDNEQAVARIEQLKTTLRKL